MRTERIRKNINELMLDPNNYRFIDNPNYKAVPENKLIDELVQKRTFNFIVGKDNKNIEDLIKSLKTNGFLDIDQIQVKRNQDYYIVLEGNRRVATLKYLYEQHILGHDIGKLSESDFYNIPLVEIIEDEPVNALISMGLHHIGGKKRWNAVNEAQLISDLLNKHSMTEIEVCEALGIKTHKLRRSIRTLNLIQLYKNSDYGDQFKSSMFTIFETVISSQKMKKWLDWDDNLFTAKNLDNQERLFSWISEVEMIEIEEDGTDRSQVLEPIITQYRQIRELSDFIEDSEAIRRMEESRSLSEGYSYNQNFNSALAETRLKNAITHIRKEVQVAFNFSEYLNYEDLNEINNLKDKLNRLLPLQPIANVVSTHKVVEKIFTQKINTKFEEVSVIRYRKLDSVTIKNISRVNIFAGGNNMGKTSILEVFYLLSQFSNLNEFLHIEKYRGNYLERFNPFWLDKNFSDSMFSGIFNEHKAKVTFKRSNITELKSSSGGYLNTIVNMSTIEDLSITNEGAIDIYANKDVELSMTPKVLCSATFSSPYRNNQALLMRAHEYAVKNKNIHKVIHFLKENIDSNIEDIEMTSNNGESRFYVSFKTQQQTIDLTNLGEGVQRIFEIGLLMIYSDNGILCIDEVDSAIHYSLLIEFTKFIQQMADEFNVQVFLSTHSKECIDAFVQNDYKNQDITGYALQTIDNRIVCKYIRGTRLEKLVESSGVDIR